MFRIGLVTSVLVLLFVITICLSCGGGGGGNPDNQQTYDRTGSNYMPTVSTKALTYSVTQNTAWTGFWGGGDDSEWEDADDTTYRRGSITVNGQARQCMKPTVAREHRMIFPIFDGTKYLGSLSDEEHRGDWADQPITILPASLPDIGQTWNTGATIYLSSFHDGVVDPGNYYEPVLAITGRIAGVESVTVPSGTYANALKVVYTGTVQMDSPSGYIAFGNETATVWFVKGLGPVKGTASSVITGGVEVVLSAVAD